MGIQAKNNDDYDDASVFENEIARNSGRIKIDVDGTKRVVGVCVFASLLKTNPETRMLGNHDANFRGRIRT